MYLHVVDSTHACMHASAITFMGISTLKLMYHAQLNTHAYRIEHVYKKIKKHQYDSLGSENLVMAPDV